jgi:methyl-accepting chemotaxis protein
MKLTNKIQIAFVLPAFFLIGIGGFSLWGFTTINRQVINIYDARVVPIRKLKAIADDYGIAIIDAVNKGHAGLMTRSEALSSITAANQRIAENWDAYHSQNLTPEEEKLAAEIIILFTAANREIALIEKVLQVQTDQDATKLLNQFDGDLYQVIDPLVNKINQLTDLQLEIAQQERTITGNIVTRIYWIFLPILFLTIISLLPIRTIITQAILGALTDTINAIAKISSEIATTSEQQKRIAEQQAISVTQTTATMEKLDTSAQKTAQQAEIAASGALKILALSKQGNQAVSEITHGMSDLKEKVVNIAVSIHQLNEQINQINLYQKLVLEIANQTNMLALNAAVEAVKAGTTGNGFSVVAKEIRKLADQSKDSTEKINHLISEIQTALKTTVQATESGTQTVEKGVIITEMTAHTFGDVIQAIDEIAFNSTQISEAAKQQAIAINQVVNNMTSINQGAIETATGVTQTQSGVERLNDTALKLKTMV